MGLFDGYHRDQGSSAEIALTLGLPVVLVVDARSAAYSLAAQIYGFLNFRKDLNIVGIIFNKVGSERHFQMLKQVCDDLHTECFGYLPKTTALEHICGLEATVTSVLCTGGHKQYLRKRLSICPWEQNPLCRP